MKKQLLFWFYLTTYTFNSNCPASQTPTTQILQTQQITQFFSVFPDPATTYPTFTDLDTAVTTLFEKTLGLPPTIMDPINRYYAYLKQQAAQEYMDTYPAPGPTCFNQALNHAQENLEIAQHHKDTQGINQWTQTVATLKTQIDQAIEAHVASDSINACRKTKSWQNHLKVFIANSYSYETQLLANVNQSEIKMFSFLPQFETAYYTTPYTDIRNNAEYIRIFLILTDIVRQRALSQCMDWAQITDPSVLYDEIEKFKTTDFYIFSQEIDTLFSQTKPTPLAHFSLMQPTTTSAAHPTKGYQDYLTCTQTPTGIKVITKPGLESLFTIQNNQPSLTPLGAFLLHEQTITGPRSTPYYGLVQTKNFSKLFQENEAGIGLVPTDLFIELISFNALRIINSLVSYLFNTENLTDTLNRLYQLESSKTFNNNLFPNPIFYEPTDLLLLEEINSLTTELGSAPVVSGASPASLRSFWHSVRHAFSQAAHTLIKEVVTTTKQVEKDSWHALKEAGNAAVDLGKSVANLGEGLYYQTGVSALVNGIAHDKWSYQGGKAGQYFNAAAKQIDAAGDNLIKVVNNIADAAIEVNSLSSNLIARTLISVADPKLAADWEKAINKVSTFVTDIVSESADFVINVTASLVALTFEGIVLIEESLVGVLMALASGGQAGISAEFGSLKESGSYFAKDLVTSILEAVTLFTKSITDTLKNLMVSIAYIVSYMTDAVVLTAGTLSGLNSMREGQSFSTGYDKVQAHSRLISSLVGLTLMVVVSVATLGTGSGLALGIGITMLAIGAGMTALQVVGANQQDLQAISQKNNQHEFVQTFSKYIKDAIPAQSALQEQMLNEMTMKLEENEVNSDRNIVYYQNYMNSTINALRATQAYQVSAFYNYQLTPDTTNYPGQNLVPADPGYLYGIQTNRYDLNPSNGFRVYNSQRKTFAQEVATLPKPLTTPANTNSSATVVSQQASTTNQTNRQHFITQKDLSSFIQPSLSVTIRWRMIYSSGQDFYIGIYLNNNYLDGDLLQALHTNFETVSQGSNIQAADFSAAWNPLNTFNRFIYNFDHLAKAFVCYQNDATNNVPALGLYEHSDKQFLIANQYPSHSEKSSSWFKRGTWYRMTATLTPNGLTGSITEENNPTLVWSGQTPVTPLTPQDYIPYNELYKAVPHYTPRTLPTGSFGVITSGAAIEYECISPTQTVTITAQRTNANNSVNQILNQVGLQPNEIIREQQWFKNSFKQTLNPTFAGWTLSPFSELSIAQGIYVYSTQGTKLVDGHGAIITDYLISLVNPPSATQIPTIGQSLMNATIGQPFTQTTQYAVSLVTGNCYTTQGQLFLNYPDTLASYQTTVNLPIQLTTAINQASQRYYAKIEGGFGFKNIFVTGVASALKKDIPLYSCPSFTPYLSGLDYLIFVQTPTNGVPGNPQALAPYSPSNTINSAVSLVTGIVFAITKDNNPLMSLPASNWNTLILAPANIGNFTQLLTNYQSYLDPALVTTIKNQTTAYTNAQQIAVQKAALTQQQQINQQTLITPNPQIPPSVTPNTTDSIQTLMFNSLNNSDDDNQGFDFSG